MPPTQENHPAFLKLRLVPYTHRTPSNWDPPHNLTHRRSKSPASPSIPGMQAMRYPRHARPAHAWASDPCPSLLAQGQPPPPSSSTLLPDSDACFPAPLVCSPDMPQQAKRRSRPGRPESPQHPQCADNPASPGTSEPHTRSSLQAAGGSEGLSRPRAFPIQGQSCPE